MDEGAYHELLNNFPSLELFEDYKAMSKPGHKYTLSEKENRRVYNDFIRSNRVWGEFYHWIKSDEFVYGVMDVLREHHIDLGYKYIPPVRRLVKQIKEIGRRRACSRLRRLR